MSSSALLVVGQNFGAVGSFKPPSASISGSERVNDAHGRFFDAAHNNRLFGGGGTLISISNITFTTATLGATATPIIGLYNPPTSPVNLSVLQAALALIQTALQSTGVGGLMWAVSVGNPGITTGNVAWNRKTLTQQGGYGKFFNGGAALTGLTTNLQLAFGSALGGGSSYNTALLGTAAGFQTQQATSVENFDGGIIVPPGGVLALLCTTTPVAHSAVPNILWEELPILT